MPGRPASWSSTKSRTPLLTRMDLRRPRAGRLADAFFVMCRTVCSKLAARSRYLTPVQAAGLPEAGTQANLDRAPGTEMGSAERIPEVVRPPVARHVHQSDAQLEIDTPTPAESLDQ